MIAIGSERKRGARADARGAEPRKKRHFFGPPLRRCAISLRACATTADATPLLFVSQIRSFSRRNGIIRIASVTGVFGFLHSAYFVPYSLVHSRLDAM